MAGKVLTVVSGQYEAGYHEIKLDGKSRGCFGRALLPIGDPNPNGDPPHGQAVRIYGWMDGVLPRPLFNQAYTY